MHPYKLGKGTDSHVKYNIHEMKHLLNYVSAQPDLITSLLKVSVLMRLIKFHSQPCVRIGPLRLQPTVEQVRGGCDQK